MVNNYPLRRAALKGGAYLVGRQVVSIALKFIGVMLITRALGPANYGTYVSVLNVYQYALLLGQAGIGVYLLRFEGEIPEKVYHTAYTLLAVMVVVILMATALGRDAISNWIGVEGFTKVAAVMFFALPFQNLAVPATVKLERALDYRSIAALEILGQISYYLLAVPLVVLGYGPISLAFSWLLQQAIGCVVAHIIAKSRPHFGFDATIALVIFRYAASFSFANWIWQLRMLVNPLIVGPALGAQAVGFIGMTIGLVETLSVIKTITWRLSVAILVRFQSDTEKLRRAVREGMELQVLAVGAPIVGFGWFGHIIIPWLFGERWLPVIDIYPYIALGYFTNAIFNMHSSVLFMAKRNIDVAIFHIFHIAIFAATVAFFIIPLGITGYGIGELTALLSYAVIHFFLARVVGSPFYLPTAIWWLGIAIGLFWSDLGLWAIPACFLALAVPPSPSRLLFYYDMIKGR